MKYENLKKRKRFAKYLISLTKYHQNELERKELPEGAQEVYQKTHT